MSIVDRRRRKFPLFFCVYSALAFLGPHVHAGVYGVDNPEAATQLATDNLGLYPVLAKCLLRGRWLGRVGLGLWVGMAVCMQVIFVMGWYFT